MTATGPELAYRTNHERLDAAISAAIGILEIVFPGRIKAYYITGSHAEGTAVKNSDADILAIFNGTASQEEKNTIFDLADLLLQIGSYFLDLEGIGEDEMAGRYGQLKHKSKFLFGEDLTLSLPEPSLEEHTQAAMNRALFFMGQIARNNQSLSYPIDFPDPGSEFHGYDNDPIEGKRDTKVLVAIVGWITTAIVAIETGQQAYSKSEAIRLYRECVKDQWADLVDQVYGRCRSDWGYQIPAGEEQRLELRQICRRVLEFENFFLSKYSGDI